MIDVLILILIISGFFITNILIFVFYWLGKEKDTTNKTIKDVLTQWPSQPLELRLVDPPEFSFPETLKMAWPDNALEVMLTESPDPHKGMATKLNRDNKPTIDAYLDVDTTALSQSEVNQITTEGVSITALGSGGDDIDNSFKLFIDTGNNNNFTFPIPSQLTLTINATKEIIIVDDIMNRVDGINAKFTLEDIDLNKLLDMTFDSATNTLKLLVIPKSSVSLPASCSGAGVKNFPLVDSDDEDLTLEIQETAAEIFELIPKGKDITAADKMSLQNERVLLRISDDKERVCLFPI